MRRSIVLWVVFQPGFFLMLLLILISFPTVCVLFKEKNGEIFRAVYLWLLSRKLLEALCFEWSCAFSLGVKEGREETGGQSSNWSMNRFQCASGLLDSVKPVKLQNTEPFDCTKSIPCIMVPCQKCTPSRKYSSKDQKLLHILQLLCWTVCRTFTVADLTVKRFSLQRLMLLTSM